MKDRDLIIDAIKQRALEAGLEEKVIDFLEDAIKIGIRIADATRITNEHKHLK